MVALSAVLSGAPFASASAAADRRAPREAVARGPNCGGADAGTPACGSLGGSTRTGPSRATRASTTVRGAGAASASGSASAGVGGSGAGSIPRAQQPDFEAIEVFVVPHSHCDLGWLRTVDEYYEEYVRYTLDSVLDALAVNKNRTFVQVETGFFARWWEEQDAATQARVKAFIASGQLEMLNGGWVMADEAVTTFEGVVNQLTLGHRFLQDTVGVKPRVAWHIDPFGASATTAAMFADMGYDAFIINRIHYELKQAWQAAGKGLQFVWRGTPSRGAGADIFTHVLDSHYSSPWGFDFEWYTPGPTNTFDLADRAPPVTTSSPSPLTPANIADRAMDLVQQMQGRALYFQTAKLLVPFGDDFKYTNAGLQYRNIERLMDHINANVDTYKVRMRFSTVGEFIDRLHEDTDMRPLPLYEADFFPYAFAPNGNRHDQAGWASANSYWAGFYTSRQQLKGYSRAYDGRIAAMEPLLTASLAMAPNATSGGARRRAAAASAVLTRSAAAEAEVAVAAGGGVAEGGSVGAMPTTVSGQLQEVRAVSGTLKHHDAETGTAVPVVVEDYAERIDYGMTLADELAAASMSAVSRTAAAAAVAADRKPHHPSSGPSGSDAADATVHAAARPAAGGAVPPRSGEGSTGRDEIAAATPEFTLNATAGLLSVCAGAGQTVPVLLFNPTPHVRRQYVRLPVPCADVAVTTPSGEAPSAPLVAVPAQVNPNTTMRVPTILPDAGAAAVTPPPRPPPVPSAFTLWALVTMPPHGYTTVFVTGKPAAGAAGTASKGALQWGVAASSLGNVTNGRVTLGFDAAAGMLSRMQIAADGTAAAAVDVAVAQTFRTYTSETQWPQSDVYIFRPNASEMSYPVVGGFGKDGALPLLARVSGPLVNEVVATYMATDTNPKGPGNASSAYVQQTLRLFSEPHAAAAAATGRAAGAAVGAGGDDDLVGVDGFVDVDIVAAMPTPNRELVVDFRTDIANTLPPPPSSTMPPAASSSALRSRAGAAGAAAAAAKPLPVWHTDANTQDMKARMRDTPAWLTDAPGADFEEPVAQNYYPASSSVFIRDEATAASARAVARAGAGSGAAVRPQFGMVSDRARGTASQLAGQLEVMLHRRCHVTDPTLPLDDITVLVSHNALFLGAVDDGSAALRHRTLAQRVLRPVVPFVATASSAAAAAAAAAATTAVGGASGAHVTGVGAAVGLRAGAATAAARRSLRADALSVGETTPASWLASHAASVSLLAAPLPLNVALQSLDAVDPQGKPGVTIVRLRHLFAAGEHPTLSAPAQVDLTGLLNGHVMAIADVPVEMTLNANAPLASVHRLQWKHVNSSDDAAAIAAADAAAAAAAATAAAADNAGLGAGADASASARAAEALSGAMTGAHDGSGSARGRGRGRAPSVGGGVITLGPLQTRTFLVTLKGSAGVADGAADVQGAEGGINARGSLGLAPPASARATPPQRGE